MAYGTDLVTFSASSEERRMMTLKETTTMVGKEF